MGRVAVTGDMCEHGAAVHLFTSQCLGEIDTIDDMISGELDVQHVKNSRIQVGRLNANVRS